MIENSNIRALAQVVFPHRFKRLAEVKNNNLKMAHYTTAENAVKILQGRSIWLRNVSLMNDFSEIQHGKLCLQGSLKTEWGSRLKATLDDVYPNLFEEVVSALNANNFGDSRHSYITSLCAHHPDDNTGRLSMWRAYGGNIAGAALIFNTRIIETDGTQLAAYTSPVLYASEHDFSDFQEVVSGLERHSDLIREVGRDGVTNLLTLALRFSVPSTKHPAFNEEQEWRVIHSPASSPSTFIKKAIESVRGVPQLIYKIHLEDKPGLDMPDISLSNLLSKVIIGPCLYPQEVAAAFCYVLSEINVSEPEKRVFISDIPLRQWG